MRYTDVQLYRRNKNLTFRGVEGRGLDRLIRRAELLVRTLLKTECEVDFTERLVEYPLVFQYIGREPRRVLDFGPVEDLFPLHLAALGHTVTGLDMRPYPFSHPRFSMRRDDILSWEPPRGAFDIAVSVSTVEHVGLGAYGDPVQESGDKIAVMKLRRAVGPGGKVILTLPAGRPTIRRGLRVYDAGRIEALAPGAVQEMRFFAKAAVPGGPWGEVDTKAISDLDWGDYDTVAPARGVALAVITGE